MTFNSKLVGQYVAIKRQVIAVFLTSLVLLTLGFPTQALEINVNGHQGIEHDTQGIEFIISDNFSRRSPFYWNLGFSHYNKLSVEWNDSDLQFPINNVVASLSYRHQFSSRNPRMRRWAMEYQLGATASLTNNKFTWIAPDKEKYFSETGDINGFIAISANYKISSKLSANVGVKHFPKMSEFGSLSSLFLGIKFKLGFNPTYYGY